LHIVFIYFSFRIFWGMYVPAFMVITCNINISWYSCQGPSNLPQVNGVYVNQISFFPANYIANPQHVAVCWVTLSPFFVPFWMSFRSLPFVFSFKKKFAPTPEIYLRCYDQNTN
jgi:hypothetical protein